MRGKFEKFQILTVMGALYHISAPINVIFGTAKPTCGPLPVPNFTFMGAIVSPLRGEKYFWTTG